MSTITEIFTENVHATNEVVAAGEKAYKESMHEQKLSREREKEKELLEKKVDENLKEATKMAFEFHQSLAEGIQQTRDMFDIKKS
jgi:hypothetical protein